MFQNANLITLLDGIPHAVVLVDENLDVSRMNRRSEALTGRSNGEATGIYADYILRTNLHPFRAYIEPVIKEKQTVTHRGQYPGPEPQDHSHPIHDLADRERIVRVSGSDDRARGPIAGAISSGAKSPAPIPSTASSASAPGCRMSASRYPYSPAPMPRC